MRHSKDSHINKSLWFKATLTITSRHAYFTWEKSPKLPSPQTFSTLVMATCTVMLMTKITALSRQRPSADPGATKERNVDF